MSDVEKRIEQWRAGLAGSETLGGGDIRELETHLREEIDHLKSLSLSEDEAFWVARRRLGDVAALEGEFAKLRPHRWLLHRLCWAITGVLLYQAALEGADAIFSLSLALGHGAGLRQSALGVLAGLVETAGFAGLVLLPLGLYLRRTRRRADSLVHASKVTPIGAAVTLVLATWAFFVAGKLVTTLFVRTVGPREFGEALVAGDVVRLLCHLAVPAVLAALFVIFYLRGKRQVPVA